MLIFVFFCSVWNFQTLASYTYINAQCCIWNKYLSISSSGGLRPNWRQLGACSHFCRIRLRINAPQSSTSLIRELPTKNFSTSFDFWTWPCAGFFGRASLFAGCHVQCCSSSKPSNSQAALSARRQALKLLIQQAINKWAALSGLLSTCPALYYWQVYQACSPIDR